MLGFDAITSKISDNKQQKANKEMMEQQEEANEQQKELLRKQNKVLERIADKGGSPQDVQVAMSGGTPGVEKGKFYSATTSIMTGLKGLGKDIWGYMKKGSMNKVLDKETGKTIMKEGAPRYQTMIGYGLAGTAGGLGTYAVNKAIQTDRKSQGIVDQPIPETKSYSFVGKAAKTIWNSAKNYKGTIAMGAGVSLIPGISYLAARGQQKSQEGASQQVPVQEQQQKSYSIVSAIKALPIVQHAGKTLLGFGNTMTSFGAWGRKDVGKFADYLAKSKNGLSSKLGNAMLAKDKAGNILYETGKDGVKTAMANKKALLGTMAVGSATTGLAWNGAEKLVNKAGRAVDPDAYTYQDNMDKQLQ